MPKRFNYQKNENDARFGAWLVMDRDHVIVSDHASRDEARQEANRLNDADETVSVREVTKHSPDFAHPINAAHNFRALSEITTDDTARAFWRDKADAAGRQVKAEA